MHQKIWVRCNSSCVYRCQNRGYCLRWDSYALTARFNITSLMIFFSKTFYEIHRLSPFFLEIIWDTKEHLSPTSGKYTWYSYKILIKKPHKPGPRALEVSLLKLKKLKILHCSNISKKISNSNWFFTK